MDTQRNSSLQAATDAGGAATGTPAPAGRKERRRSRTKRRNQEELAPPRSARVRTGTARAILPPWPDRLRFEGIDRVEAMIRNLDHEAAYLVIWEHDRQKRDDRLARLNLDVASLLPWLDPEEGTDQADATDTADDSASHLAGGTAAPDVNGQPTTGEQYEAFYPDLLDAACRWLRDAAIRHMAGARARAFRVRVFAHKGAYGMDGGSFVVWDPGWKQLPKLEAAPTTATASTGPSEPLHAARPPSSADRQEPVRSSEDPVASAEKQKADAGSGVVSDTSQLGQKAAASTASTPAQPAAGRPDWNGAHPPLPPRPMSADDLFRGYMALEESCARFTQIVLNSAAHLHAMQQATTRELSEELYSAWQSAAPR